MNKYSSIFCSRRIVVLLFVMLSACTSCNPLNTSSRPDSCSSIGQTHTVIAAAQTPDTQGTWSTFHGNLERNGVTAPSDKRKLSLAWLYCTGDAISASPVVANGLVYAASTDDSLTALDIRSGRVVWQHQLDSALYSTPAIEQGMLYAASLDGSIYAFDARTGNIHWRYQSDTPNAKFWSSPAVAQGSVIVGVASVLSESPKVPGQLLALDERTGKLLWRHWTLDGKAAGGGIWSSASIDAGHGVIYVATGDPDDGVIALSLYDGRVIWHWRSVVRDVHDTDIGAGPTLYHDRQGKLRVVVGGKDGSIYCLDGMEGHVIWHTQVGTQVFSSPAFADNAMYAIGASSGKATVWRLDAQSGAVIWKHAIAKMVYASPAISGQTLYISIGNGFGPGDGGVEVIDTTDGHLIQFADMHSTTNSSPAAIASWVFVGAHDGNIDAFIRSY